MEELHGRADTSASPLWKINCNLWFITFIQVNELWRILILSVFSVLFRRYNTKLKWGEIKNCFGVLHSQYHRRSKKSVHRLASPPAVTLWWCHQMETFSRYWPFVRGICRSPVNSSHKDQWRVALMFPLTRAWTELVSSGMKNARYHHPHVAFRVQNPQVSNLQTSECSTWPKRRVAVAYWQAIKAITISNLSNNRSIQ